MAEQMAGWAAFLQGMLPGVQQGIQNRRENEWRREEMDYKKALAEIETRKNMRAMQLEEAKNKILEQKTFAEMQKLYSDIGESQARYGTFTVNPAVAKKLDLNPNAGPISYQDRQLLEGSTRASSGLTFEERYALEKLKGGIELKKTKTVQKAAGERLGQTLGTRTQLSREENLQQNIQNQIATAKQMRSALLGKSKGMSAATKILSEEELAQDRITIKSLTEQINKLHAIDSMDNYKKKAKAYEEFSKQQSAAEEAAGVVDITGPMTPPAAAVPAKAEPGAQPVAKPKEAPIPLPFKDGKPDVSAILPDRVYIVATKGGGSAQELGSNILKMLKK